MARPHAGCPRRNEALMQAFLASEEMKEMGDYVARGRRFERKKRLELDVLYAVTAKLVLVDERLEYRRTLWDLGAELGLRGLPKPLHLLEGWLPLIRERTLDAERDPAVQGEMTRMLGDFAREIAAPKH